MEVREHKYSTKDKNRSQAKKSTKKDDGMKCIYFYADETGMEHVFQDPMPEEQMIINGYRFIRSEWTEDFPWEVEG